MYVPRVRRSGVVVPRPLITGLAATCASLTAILLAGLFTRSTSDETAISALPLADASEGPGAIVYAVANDNFDRIYVRNVEGEETRRRVASFPVSLIGLHIRGAVTPVGGMLAVLHLESGGGAEARLSLVDVAGAETRTVEGAFDYLSRMAWSPDGARLALVQRIPSADPSRGFAVFEVDARTLERRAAGMFEDAFEAVPVGYRPSGELLVVTVDPAGSSLWAQDGDAFELLSTFSPGLTSDWSLSPDGERLAFINHLGAGDRSRAGRVLAISSGRVTDVLGEGEQLGAVWRPGSPLPDFGGPGGTVLLSEGDEGGYLVPLSWTPDGAYLIATVFTPTAEGSVTAGPVEVVSQGRRVLLAEEGVATFFGLVPGE